MRFTADTIEAVRALYPGVRFLWLMGADNLIQFHRWERWRDIVEQVPMGVLARPGQQTRAGLSPTARLYAQARHAPPAARRLILQRAPAWTILSGPMIDASSTAIRQSGAWVR